MHEVYAHEPYPGSGPSIFLAGPSPRDQSHPNWRIPEATSYLRSKGFEGTVFIPLPRNGEWLPNYNAQIDWELGGLDRALVRVFWVPRDLELLPGFTTNVEFGLYLKQGNIILGYPEHAPKMRYLHYLAEKHGVPVFHDLYTVLDIAIGMARKPRRPRFLSQEHGIQSRLVYDD